MGVGVGVLCVCVCVRKFLGLDGERRLVKFPSVYFGLTRIVFQTEFPKVRKLIRITVLPLSSAPMKNILKTKKNDVKRFEETKC